MPENQIDFEYADLTASNKDYAIFLPSISSIYVKMLSQDLMGKRDKFPSGLRRGWDDLDFLQTKGDLFSYKWALYSAGHAQLDVTRTDTEESMVQQRDRQKTVIIGDSGGFQAATGVLKWPWKPKKNQDDIAWRADQDAFRLGILRWLEHTADWSMIFDFPPGGIDRFGYDEKTGEAKHPGLKSYADCLKGSIENAEFFMKHRKPGATKFLNVLQGRNLEEGDEWWEICKDWPFESWAFANIQGHSIALNLRRIITMRDGGYLSNGQDWLHYLGNGKIKAACSLTNIQRCLRKYVNPNVTLSYDAASPFVMTAKGQMYSSYSIDPDRMTFKGGPIPDSKALKGSTTLLRDYSLELMEKQRIKLADDSTFGNLFDSDHTHRAVMYETAISRKVTLGDICIKGHEDVNGKEIEDTIEAIQHSMGLVQWEQFEQKRKKYPSALDGLSYLLLMNHNVELHIRACQEAVRWMDQPLSVARQHLPSDVLEFKDLCEDIFTSEKPMTLIEKHRTMLTNGTGMNADNSLSMDINKLWED
jgi:hypothetical protein